MPFFSLHARLLDNGRRDNAPAAARHNRRTLLIEQRYAVKTCKSLSIRDNVLPGTHI